VWLGFLTLLAIWYQAYQTARATKAMEKSSSVLMDIERSRILVHWDNLIHLDESPTGIHDGSLSHHFNWACANVGKSQATLTRLWARFIAVKHLADLPEKPDFSARNGFLYQGEPLQPSSGKKPQTQWFSTTLETPLSYDEMEAKHRSREYFVYAYGYAQYEDIWGRPHETRFGVFYDSQPELNFDLDQWVVAGPPDYNKHT
jgi:hypothetical protein